MLFEKYEIDDFKVCKELALNLQKFYDNYGIDYLGGINQLKVYNTVIDIIKDTVEIIGSLEIVLAWNPGVPTGFVKNFNGKIQSINKNLKFFEVTISFLDALKVFYFDLESYPVLSKEFSKRIHLIVREINNIYNHIKTNKVKDGELNLNLRNLMDRLERLTVNKINESLSINDINIKQISDKSSKEATEYLEQLYDNTNKKTSDILAKLQQEISDLQASTTQNITKQIKQIKIDLAKSNTELVGLVGDLDAYKSIVNHETEKEISKHYAKKATSEMITYWIATILSIVIIIVSICLAWFGLNGYFETYVQETDPKKLKALAQTARYAEIYLGFRLVLSFLLFSTVIYTSRIAYRAYIHWRHSESMKLKLSSLRPFINQLEPDDRKQIHKDLVPDYFGKDAGMIDVAGEKFKDFPTNVSAVVMKAMDHANGALGNSKKDEPAKDDKNSAEKDKKEEA